MRPGENLSWLRLVNKIDHRVIQVTFREILGIAMRRFVGRQIRFRGCIATALRPCAKRDELELHELFRIERRAQLHGVFSFRRRILCRLLERFGK